MHERAKDKKSAFAERNLFFNDNVRDHGDFSRMKIDQFNTERDGGSAGVAGASFVG